MKTKVTPQKAAQWLSEAGDNPRRLSATAVRTLAREISKGKWEYNGQSIKFNGDGLLVDGFHRLNAVVMSGATIVTEVIKGVESVNELDRGKRRSAADSLSRLGFHNCVVMQSVATYCWRYATGRVRTTRADQIPVSTVIEIAGSKLFANNFTDIIMHGLFAGEKIAKVSSIAGPLLLFSHRDKGMSETFANQVATGENITRNDPAHALRKRLIDNAGSEVKVRTTTISRWTVQAINSMYKDEKRVAMRRTSVFIPLCMVSEGDAKKILKIHTDDVVSSPA